MCWRCKPSWTTCSHRSNSSRASSRCIDNQTAYSTLIVALSEPGPHHPAPVPAASGVTKAWHDSLHGFAVGVDGIIRLGGPFLFALLCLAALVFGGRLTWRRLQRHNL